MAPNQARTLDRPVWVDRSIRLRSVMKPKECSTVQDVLDSLIDEIERQGGIEKFLAHYPTIESIRMAHHELGRQIRNTYGLWGEDGSNGAKIVEDAMARYVDPEHNEPPYRHPDSVSSLILQLLWIEAKTKADRNFRWNDVEL